MFSQFLSTSEMLFSSPESWQDRWLQLNNNKHNNNDNYLGLKCLCGRNTIVTETGDRVNN